MCSEGLAPGEGFLYDVNGIEPCQIDTSVPGIYTLDFRVHDSSNPPNVASVSRIVVVEAVNDCSTLGELCDQESPVDVLFQDSPPVLTLLGSSFVQVKQVGYPCAQCLFPLQGRGGGKGGGHLLHTTYYLLRVCVTVCDRVWLCDV